MGSRLLFVLAFLLVTSVSAEESMESDEAFGGPSGVSGEEQENRELLDAYRVDNRVSHLKGWYDWKADLKQRTGFSFGFNGQVLYQGASETQGEHDDAFGGIYRLQGEWELVGRESGDTGSIVFRIENRSKIGSGIPPASMRGEIGAATIDPGFAYSDKFGTHFSTLAWQQLFANKRAGIAVGLLDFSAYLDAFYFQTISRGFLNRNFILNPTLATTGIGAMGAVGKSMIGDQFWIGGGFYDANAKSGDPSFDTWDSGELLKHIEIGWTPGFDRRSTDRVQLTWWHKDELKEKGSPEGSGWLLSYSWKVHELYVPFLRVGRSDGGGGALAKRSVSGGVARQMRFQDWLTLGVGWNDPSVKTYGSDLGTETVFEASYLWQITANTSLLPNAQLILNPALNSEVGKLWALGLRLRVAL